MKSFAHQYKEVLRYQYLRSRQTLEVQSVLLAILDMQTTKKLSDVQIESFSPHISQFQKQVPDTQFSPLFLADLVQDQSTYA